MTQNIGKVVLADVGITRQEIHEARQISDAEKRDPGIVRGMLTGLRRRRRSGQRRYSIVPTQPRFPPRPIRPFGKAIVVPLRKQHPVTVEPNFEFPGVRWIVELPTQRERHFVVSEVVNACPAIGCLDDETGSVAARIANATFASALMHSDRSARVTALVRRNRAPA